MTYSFDIDVAKEYGVNAAIMIHNFQFWIKKHRAENKNYYDGCHWTYNSVRGWSELFCFWTPKQIRNILDNLIERGVLKKGNYNQNPYDRTLWYAFVDEEKWVGPNDQIDLPKQANVFVQTGQPIPDINTDKNTNNNQNIKKESVKEKKVFGEFGNVKLTDAEYDKLKEFYGDNIDIAISVLDNYLASKEKRYKSHYAVMKKNGWVDIKVKEITKTEMKESAKRW